LAYLLIFCFFYLFYLVGWGVGGLAAWLALLLLAASAADDIYAGSNEMGT
jgi:hypothetical protein